MKKLFLFIAFAIAVMGCKKNVDAEIEDGWDGSVIMNIEAVNIDNSGEFPIVSVMPIKKEAYMLGVIWTIENKFITGSIQKDEQYGFLGDRYLKAIKCNTQFSADIPVGRYISNFFKEIDRNYLPSDIDEGFVLLVAPDAGEHSFRIEYYEGNNLVCFHDTPLINFY